MALDKIDNACKRDIADANDLPDVSAAAATFFQPMKVQVLVKSQVGGYTQEIPSPQFVETLGVRQPFSPEQLQQKPEGERSWIWSKLHVVPGLSLKTDDLIYIRGVKYRVMSRSDYAEYGYLEYDLVEDVREE